MSGMLTVINCSSSTNDVPHDKRGSGSTGLIVASLCCFLKQLKKRRVFFVRRATKQTVNYHQSKSGGFLRAVTTLWNYSRFPRC
ncbi:MAG: hypothetical protein ACXAEU_19025 [Candidatus Hodarchaeales archaeon]